MLYQYVQIYYRTECMDFIFSSFLNTVSFFRAFPFTIKRKRFACQQDAEAACQEWTRSLTQGYLENFVIKVHKIYKKSGRLSTSSEASRSTIPLQAN